MANKHKGEFIDIAATEARIKERLKANGFDLDGFLKERNSGFGIGVIWGIHSEAIPWVCQERETHYALLKLIENTVRLMYDERPTWVSVKTADYVREAATRMFLDK